LPATVEAAIFRIVQESITNVVRHSDASRVEIDVQQTEDMVTISVVNDSRSGPEQPSEIPVVTGSGLAGMRERTTLLGGTFSAGRQASGFAVRAQIPLEVTR
jgi:signal transduction histidine kinase